MQDITPLILEGKKTIDSYGESGFTISKEKFNSSVVVFPDEVLLWNVESFDGLDESSFAKILSKSDDIDLLLLGVGKEFKFLDSKLVKMLNKVGISVESMDTGAACRTYNVLLSEGRKVAAALISLQ